MLLEKHVSEKHTTYTKLFAPKTCENLSLPVLKQKTNLTAPKCLVFANHLASVILLSSLPPPQACLELACASSCFRPTLKFSSYLSTQLLCLGTVTAPSVALIWPTICFLPLLCPLLGNVRFLRRVSCSLPGNTGPREQPDETFPAALSEMQTRTWTYPSRNYICH